MEVIRTNEAAELLGLRISTLEAWRCRGGGPAFLKLGKAVRYRKSDLENFMAERIRRNTSDGGPMLNSHSAAE